MLKFTPSKDIFVNAINILYQTGIDVRNSKEAYAMLENFQRDAFFCSLLCYIFSLHENPFPDINIPGKWTHYRQLAGIVLKNNLTTATYSLGEEIFVEAGRGSVKTIKDPTDAQLVRVAAQIIAKITSLTSLQWWKNNGICDIAVFLLEGLSTSCSLRTLGSLHALEFLVEDAPDDVGESSETIIGHVSQLILNSQTIEVQMAAFRMVLNIYSQGSLLDWFVDNLSPLQQGLSAGSRFFALTCVRILELNAFNNIGFLLNVICACNLILPYIDSFFPVIPAECQQQLIQCWTISMIKKLDSKDNQNIFSSIEAQTCCFEFLFELMKLYNQTGGEGYVSLFNQPIQFLIPALIPMLLKYIPISDTEVEEILAEDDHNIRDTINSSQNTLNSCYQVQKHDLIRDDSTDLSPDNSTVRMMASRCLDECCVFSPSLAYPILLDYINTNWSSDNWKMKEASVLVVGTMIMGCLNEFIPHATTLLDQLLFIIDNNTDHICVVSMALWACSRLCSWASSECPELLQKMLPTVLHRLESHSKRVQNAAITTVIEIVHYLPENVSSQSFITSVISNLTPFILKCLSLYHTNNLSLLSYLISYSLNYLSSEDRSLIFDALIKERTILMLSFEESFQKYYIEHQPNVVINKDIFSIERVILTGIIFFKPPIAIPESSFLRWTKLIENLVHNSYLDDAEILSLSLRSCFQALLHLRTEFIISWINETKRSFSDTLCHLLKLISNETIVSLVLMVIHHLINVIGPSAFSTTAFESLIDTLLLLVNKTQDLFVFDNAFSTITTIIAQIPEITQEHICVLNSLISKLRPDAFAETLIAHINMAYTICKVIFIHPYIISSINIENVLLLVKKSVNDDKKSQATIALALAIITKNPSGIPTLLPLIVNMVISWQQSAENFPDTFEALAKLMNFLNQFYHTLLENFINSLPSSCALMLRELYFSKNWS